MLRMTTGELQMNTFRLAAICSALVLMSACRKGGYLEDHVAHMASADLSAPRASTQQGQDVGNLNYPASNARAAAPFWRAAGLASLLSCRGMRVRSSSKDNRPARRSS